MIDNKPYQSYRQSVEIFKLLVWSNLVLLKFLLMFYGYFTLIAKDFVKRARFDAF